jgi:hypothetical protein
MTRAILSNEKSRRRAVPFNFWERLKEIDMFFQGKSREFKTMRRLVENLNKKRITYAIMGAMAVNAHRHKRTTSDVDILLTPQGFAEFLTRFVPRSYDRVAGRPRRFLDRRHHVTFDILVTGLFPGSGKPGPIAFPDPAQVSVAIKGIRVVDLPTLIQLKLAARRHTDFGDVVNLIRVHNLDEAFLAKLHPSVRRDFVECLDEKRREDEYEARQDQSMRAMLAEHNTEPSP